MAQLAIKGHATRGKEVIGLLEMLGGMMKGKLMGTETFCAYYIDSDSRIDYKHYSRFDDAIQFTLEEFLEKFPYKVGDKVIFTKYGDNDVVTVESMSWTGTTIEYNYNGGVPCLAKDLQPYKEETMKSKPNLLQQLKEYFDNTPRDVLEKEWHEYDKYNEIGPTVNEYLKYVNKSRQPQYPKTYRECAEIVEFNIEEEPTIFGYKEELLDRFQKLLICRDAYWKIAGKQMGLGKPWSPSKNGNVYCIFRLKGEIVKDNFVFGDSLILEFPIEEMRDSFYENFKDLINQCKELL